MSPLALVIFYRPQNPTDPPAPTEWSPLLNRYKRRPSRAHDVPLSLQKDACVQKLSRYHAERIITFFPHKLSFVPSHRQCLAKTFSFWSGQWSQEMKKMLLFVSYVAQKHFWIGLLLQHSTSFFAAIDKLSFFFLPSVAKRERLFIKFRILF